MFLNCIYSANQPCVLRAYKYRLMVYCSSALFTQTYLFHWMFDNKRKCPSATIAISNHHTYPNKRMVEVKIRVLIFRSNTWVQIKKYRTKTMSFAVRIGLICIQFPLFSSKQCFRFTVTFIIYKYTLDVNYIIFIRPPPTPCNRQLIWYIFSYFYREDTCRATRGRGFVIQQSNFSIL
jgi:hypothetical protein